MKSNDTLTNAIMQHAKYLVSQPLLGAGNYPEAERLVAQSDRLRRDLQEELDYYNEHPDCDNVRIWHCAHVGTRASYWSNRWGKYVLTYRTGRWHLRVSNLSVNPAKRRTSRPAYYSITMVVNNRQLHPFMHILISDMFVINDDFTKTQCDHINGNHLDNNALNLERVTPEENQRRKNCGYYTKRGLPVPEKYQTPKNYQIYLQSKKLPKRDRP